MKGGAFEECMLAGLWLGWVVLPFEYDCPLANYYTLSTTMHQDSFNDTQEYSLASGAVYVNCALLVTRPSGMNHCSID